MEQMTVSQSQRCKASNCPEDGHEWRPWHPSQKAPDTTSEHEEEIRLKQKRKEEMIADLVSKLAAANERQRRKTAYKLARKYKIHWTTVYKYVRQFHNPPPPKEPKKLGRPRKYTDDDMRFVVANDEKGMTLQSNLDEFAAHLRAEPGRLGNKKPSTTTILRLVRQSNKQQ